MDVSVVIINFNTFDLTCKCIQGVYSWTTGCSFEIIIVDNGSTERDPQDFVKKFPEIKLVKNRVNAGFAKGNNLALEVATGDFVLLLNSDTEFINNAIYICLQVIKNDSRIAVVGCRLTFPDGNTQHNCQRFPSIRYKLLELFRIQKVLPSAIVGKLLLGSFFSHNEAVFPDWIWGTFFMFRRDLLLLLPGNKLAEDFFMYVEDMQWCKDFRELGYRIAFVSNAQTLHYMGKSSGIGRKVPMIDANTRLFMERYYSPWRRFLIKICDRLLS